MTGETLTTEEKIPQSPASPTDTDATFQGDAIIEIGESDNVPSRPASTHTGSSVSVEVAQPESKKKRPSILRRITDPFKSEPDQIHTTETRTRKLEETPEGFPRLAAFQSSEANFALYRSFSYLHSRVLLDLQDEITCLEKELDDKDWDDFDEDPDRLKSRELDIDRASTSGDERTRRDILKDIRDRLKEYDKILIRARTLEAFQKPSERNYRSVRKYYTNEKPVMDAEMNSIRSKEDIVSLNNGREWASFDGAVESAIGFADDMLMKVFRTKNRPLQKYFRTPELQAKTDNKYINLYSSSRIDKLVNILITFVIFVLLVIPVVTLYHLTSTSAMGGLTPANGTDTVPPSAVEDYNRDTFKAVGVLIVFTLLFSAAMSSLQIGRAHV